MDEQERAAIEHEPPDDLELEGEVTEEVTGGAGGEGGFPGFGRANKIDAG